MAPHKPPYLEPSPLGTKEYWDALYSTELSNHAADPSDVGTIWFDDSSAEDKVLSYLHSAELNLDLEKTSFLDIGTGNGHFLFRLRENPDSEAEDKDEEEDHGGGDVEAGDRKQPHNGGFKGRILGTDYSPNSIAFARQLAASKSLSSPSNPLGVELLHFDILTSSASLVLTPPNEKGWDVVLDKGTFDAISLSSEADASGCRIVERYRERVVPLIRDGGYFLVTSCNWTEEELRDWFEGPYVYGAGERQERMEDGTLEYVGRIVYPSFSFGGRKGQTISSACFRKAKT